MDDRRFTVYCCFHTWLQWATEWLCYDSLFFVILLKCFTNVFMPIARVTKGCSTRACFIGHCLLLSWGSHLVCDKRMPGKMERLGGYGGVKRCTIQVFRFTRPRTRSVFYHGRNLLLLSFTVWLLYEATAHVSEYKLSSLCCKLLLRAYFGYNFTGQR
jgi:hypothetical protein